MRRFAFSAAALAVVAAMSSIGSAAPKAPSSTTTSAKTTGNGAPAGAHYTLNVIGVAKDKTASMTGSDRHTIFMPLYRKASIYLAKGDFQVLDGNGTDGTAKFQLPDPDPDGDGTTSYSVYARALGKPGGSAIATSCYTDADGTTWCSTENVVLVRSTGKSTFSNVSKELLTVCVDTDGDGDCDTREFLFDDSTHDYFWSYDNKGLRIAQLRFYEIPTVVGLNP